MQEDDRTAWTAGSNDGWDKKMRLRSTVRKRMRQTEIWEQWSSPRSAQWPIKSGSNNSALYKTIECYEDLHITALPGWYMEIFHVSYIHHQLIFHELFIQGHLTCWQEYLSPRRSRVKHRGKIHYSPPISGEVIMLGRLMFKCKGSRPSAWFQCNRCSSGVRLNVNVTT